MNEKTYERKLENKLRWVRVACAKCGRWAGVNKVTVQFEPTSGKYVCFRSGCDAE